VTPEFLLRSLGDANLDGREDAVDWLRSAGLLAEDAEITNSEHGALIRLRDALRDVLALRGAGKTDPEAAARLSRALADGRLVVTVTAQGAPKLASSARAPYSSAVAAIAITVAEAWLIPGGPAGPH
jgi:hypothetical protein